MSTDDITRAFPHGRVGLDDDDLPTSLDRPQLIEEAVTKKEGLAAVERVRFMPYAKGASVQILHIGSYDSEAPVLARLHEEYLPEHGLPFNGDHHDVYLSDPRRTAPAKLRTILRQPVADLDPSVEPDRTVGM